MKETKEQVAQLKKFYSNDLAFLYVADLNSFFTDLGLEADFDYGEQKFLLSYR